MVDVTIPMDIKCECGSYGKACRTPAYYNYATNLCQCGHARRCHVAISTAESVAKEEGE